LGLRIMAWGFKVHCNQSLYNDGGATVKLS